VRAATGSIRHTGFNKGDQRSASATDCDGKGHAAGLGVICLYAVVMGSSIPV